VAVVLHCVWSSQFSCFLFSDMSHGTQGIFHTNAEHGEHTPPHKVLRIRYPPHWHCARMIGTSTCAGPWSRLYWLCLPLFPPFCLQLGLRWSVFAAFWSPYARRGILDVLNYWHKYLTWETFFLRTGIMLPVNYPCLCTCPKTSS